MAVTPLVVLDNAVESSLSYIQGVRRMQFTRDGRQQLAVVTGIYGTGAAWELCVLGLVKGALTCWELPDWRPAMAPLLAADEESWKSLLISVADDRLLVEALIYDKAHDPNCCPSRGSLFVELDAPAGSCSSPSAAGGIPRFRAARPQLRDARSRMVRDGVRPTSVGGAESITIRAKQQPGAL